MGKRKRKKLSSTLTWKATKGFFRLLFQGALKASPLLFFGAVGFAIFWGIRKELYADPGFIVQNIEVVPEGVAAPSKIEELERLYLGQNLFKISLKKTAENIEKDPRIREARVIRQFPNALRIEITARKSFAQIQFSPKGPYYSAGEDGVVLDTSLARDDKLLLVEVLEAKSAKLEIGKDCELLGFNEVVNLAGAFWRHPLARSEAVERFRLDHLGNVSLVLRKGPELRFGRHPMKKFYTLDTITPLLKAKDRDRILYVELQYQDLIVRKK